MATLTLEGSTSGNVVVTVPAISGTGNTVTIPAATGTLALASTSTSGGVFFGGATSGVLYQDATNFFWDDSNNRLGIGTNSPASPLSVNGAIAMLGSSSGSVTLATDAAAGTYTWTFKNGGANANVGYLEVPQVSKTTSYTTVLSDSGKHIYANGTSITITIDSNNNVAYPTGTVLTFININSTSLSIAITSDTMYLAGTGTTGTRTLAQYGMATAIKLTSTTWLISGTGLT